MADLKLSSEDLEVIFDEDTGSIRQIKIPKFGLKVVTNPEMGENWRLSVPLVTDWTYLVYGKSQKITSRKLEDDRVIFVWDSIEIEGVSQPIKLITEFKVVKDELHARMTVENNSNYSIDYIWFPIVGGITQLYPTEKDNLCVPYLSPKIEEDPFSQDWPDYHNRYWYQAREVRTYGYPFGWMGMQWLDLFNSNSKGGLFISSQDNERFCTLFIIEHERAKSPMTFSIVKAPFIKGYETVTLPKAVVSLHEGDWHKGAEKYKNWMSSWFKRKKQAEWIRNLDGWLAFQGHAGDYHIAVPYEDYPKWLDKAKSVGLNTIHVHCGVHEQGIEGGFPYWNNWSKRMGGKEKLLSAIDEIHKKGGYIVTFAKDNKVNLGLPEFFERFYKYAIKARDGGFPQVHYPIGTIDMQFAQAFLANMCRADKSWHEFIVPIFEDLAKTGLDGVMIDEWCSGHHFCFDRSHSHSRPSDQWIGQLELGRKIASVWYQYNPNHLLAGEEIWDASYEFMDLSFSRGNSKCDYQIYRYTLPWMQRTAEILEDQYDHLNHAFACDFIFALCFDYYHSGPEAYPEFSKYLRDVIKIRKEIRSYFLEGEFLDTLAHKISDTTGHIDMRTYRLGNKDLVIIYNRDPKSVQFNLNLDWKPKQIKIYKPGEPNSFIGGKEGFAESLKGNQMMVLELT